MLNNSSVCHNEIARVFSNDEPEKAREESPLEKACKHYGIRINWAYPGDPNEAIDHILNAIGATIQTQRKHKVYVLPNGIKYTQAKTASDHRTALNELSVLKKLLISDFK